MFDHLRPREESRHADDEEIRIFGYVGEDILKISVGVNTSSKLQLKNNSDIAYSQAVHSPEVDHV